MMIALFKNNEVIGYEQMNSPLLLMSLFIYKLYYLIIGVDSIISIR
jgi:hypothetical protein